MKFNQLEIPGLVLVELKLNGDSRGFFVERFSESRFAEAGLPTRYHQDNHSRSAPGVVRGLHYQFGPPQGKLVGCIHGRLWDVAVDIRPDSPAYGKHFGVELSDTNGLLLWMPPGFAHGFCALGDQPADMLYKVTMPYSQANEGGIAWNDADLKIPWPVNSPTISARDQKQQTFAEYKRAPIPWSKLASELG